MSDHVDSLRQLQSTIERLDPDSRESLKHWLFLNIWEDEDGNRVAESVPNYESEYISVEEYLQREAVSPVRHEYVDGQIFAMSGARWRHSVISTNVFTAVNNHVRDARGPCRAYMENFKVELRSRSKNFLYYPDVMVACGKVGPDSVSLEDPRLIIEVLSPCTARVDRNEKALNYRRIPTLEEYVLIAQQRCEVTIQRRRDEWKPSMLTSVDQTLYLESLVLSLHLADIYDGTL